MSSTLFLQHRVRCNLPFDPRIDNGWCVHGKNNSNRLDSMGARFALAGMFAEAFARLLIASRVAAPVMTLTFAFALHERRVQC